jgi:formylglycine-generating enzyme required for sulfatase activity
MVDYYDILELSLDATTEQIKTQYRFLVQAWHPDKFHSAENKAKAEEKLRLINEAYSVLKDAEKRRIFDLQRQSASPLEKLDPVSGGNDERGKHVNIPHHSPEELAAEEFARKIAAKIKRREAEKSRMRALNLQLSPRVVMGFVRVPAGKFTMGSETVIDPAAKQDEKPSHLVYLVEYLIGQTQVTNIQYQAFLQSTGYRKPSNWVNGDIPEGKADHPVVNVSWVDANEFCKWVSLLFSMKIRLPSEAEWEKASRGADGRIYPWGNQTPDVGLAVFNTNDTFQTGENLAGMSPYGALDMAGNAWEWVNDFYAKTYYMSSPTNNPQGPIWGEERVLRGGCFASPAETLRCACRSRALPSGAIEKFTGFRCAVSL